MPKIQTPKPRDQLPIIPITTQAHVAGIAPFKDNIPPYGAFANTTLINHNSNNPPIGDYPITQTKTMSGQDLTIDGQKQSLTWPSSEHAYHAQKIIAYKEKLYKVNPNDPKIQTLDKMLKELTKLPKVPKTIFLPSNHSNPNDPNTYTGLVNAHLSELGLNSKIDFDVLCGAQYHPIHKPNDGINQNTHLPINYDYMKYTVKMKLEQHPELKELAKEFARRGVMPVEISQHDPTWASFSDGSGKNYLGIIILELGNDFLLKDENIKGLIQDPHRAYEALPKNKVSFAQISSYVNQGQQTPFPTKLPTPIQQQPSLQTSSATPKQMNTAADRIKQATGASQVALTDDHNRPNQVMVKLTFDDKTAADAFSKTHGNAPKGADNVVLLGEARAAEVFKKLGIATHGRQHPHSMLDALKFEALKTPTPVSHYFNHHNRSKPDTTLQFFLKKHGFKSAHHKNDDGETPLIKALKEERLDIFEQLLKDKNININEVDNAGKTALSWASELGRYNFMNALESGGADFQKPDNEGNTPLSIAIKNKFLECANYIYKKLTGRDLFNENFDDQSKTTPDRHKGSNLKK